MFLHPRARHSSSVTGEMRRLAAIRGWEEGVRQRRRSAVTRMQLAETKNFQFSIA